MVFVEDVSELLLPMPVYLVALILGLCVYAFRHKETRLGRMRYALIALSIWSCLVTVPVVANVMIAQFEQKYPRPDVNAGDGPGLVVVLSGGYSRGWNYIQLDRDSWERTYAGVRLWRQIGGKLLFVGGAVPNKASVAEAMSDLAQSLGVPKAAILLETKSQDTYQNLLLSRDLIRQFGDKSWLVSSALHLPRAMAVAQALGLRLRAYPCDYRAVPSMGWGEWLPSNGGPPMFTLLLHELIGLGYYRIRGYAK